MISPIACRPNVIVPSLALYKQSLHLENKLFLLPLSKLPKLRIPSLFHRMKDYIRRCCKSFYSKDLVRLMLSFITCEEYHSILLAAAKWRVSAEDQFQLIVDQCHHSFWRRSQVRKWSLSLSIIQKFSVEIKTESIEFETVNLC